jgi:hypothetical protein
MTSFSRACPVGSRIASGVSTSAYDWPTTGETLPDSISSATACRSSLLIFEISERSADTASPVPPGSPGRPAVVNGLRHHRVEHAKAVQRIEARHVDALERHGRVGDAAFEHLPHRIVGPRQELSERRVVLT